MIKIEHDPLYRKAVEIVVQSQRGSASYLQITLGIGYGRAARMIEWMKQDGIVGNLLLGNVRNVVLRESQLAGMERKIQHRVLSTGVDQMNEFKQDQNVQSAVFEMISPAKAKVLLDASGFKNRPINTRRLRLYAEEMRNGDWKENGESIIIGADGSIVDGQHRLQALILADKTIGFIVVRNVNPNVFDTIDSGRNRSGADTYAVAGVPKYHKDLASSLPLLDEFFKCKGVAFRTDGLCVRNEAHFKRVKYLDLLQKYPDFIDSVSFIHSRSKSRVLQPRTLHSVLHYLFGLSNPVLRDKFYEKFVELEFETPDCPVKQLRKLVDKDYGAYRNSPRAKAALWIKTWNAFKLKRSVVLKWSNEHHEFPEIL